MNGKCQTTITFSTPFEYNGGNLLIGCDNTTDKGFNNIFFYGQTVSGASVSGYNGSSLANVSASQQNFIPKTTFTYEKDDPTCPKPANLTVSGITAHTATVTWESDFTNFNLRYKASTTDVWTEVNGLTAKSYALTTLNSGATYQVQVQAIGTGETSKWKKASFNTLESTLTAPTDLACTDVTSTTATLSWTESGTATAWQICLDGDEANLITVTENPHTLTALTSEHVYSARVRAVNGAGDDWSAWSDAVSFMPTNRVTIGSGSSTQYYGLPTNTGMKYTFSQQLYTPDQLGSTPCTFTGMDFMGTNFYSSDKPSVLRKLDIYLVQTDQTIFNGSSWTDWVPITYDNLVFSGNVTFLENEWTVINFDTPFIYDGTKNVCVVVYDHTGTAGYNGHYVTFKTNGTISSYGTYQSMYADGSSEYDMTNLTFKGSSCSRSNNYIRLLKDNYPTCERPTAVNTGTITPYTATVTWEGSGSTWNLQYKLSDADEWTTVEGLTTQSYTLTGLTPESTYYVGVQTDCGGGDLSLWRRTTFTTTEVTPTPSALACTGYTATTATLSWTENGEATAWQVSVLGGSAAETIVEADSNPFTVTGLTEDVIYTFKVRATKDGLTSHWTDAVSVQPTDKLCLGWEGTTSHSSLPYDSQTNYTLSQQIYTTAELGTTPCSFTSVDFLLKSDIALKRTLDIYMVQTDKTTFDSSSDWIAFTTDDRVFSGEVQTVKNAWTSITFDTPFMYDGLHNVVLIVYDKTNYQHSSISWATYSTGDNYQALYGTKGYEVELTALNDFWSYRVKQKNQIRLMPGAYNSCQKPTAITVSNVTTTSATISWTSEAELFDLLVDGQLVEGITATTYEMTNLAMASVHEVQVRTNCSGGSVSPWSNAVSFNTILCDDGDKCTISYELSINSEYYSSWYGDAIQVLDVLTGEVLDNWTITNSQTVSGTLAVCNGRQIQFAWKDGGGAPERCVYSVYDNNGDLIFSGTGRLNTPVTHTVDCTPRLTTPTDLACNATTGGTTATLSWTEKGTATAWQICLDDDETNLFAANSNPFTIEGLTNNTFHTAKVRAVGDNIVSKWSDAITFEVTSKVRIGTGTNSYERIPTDIYYKYSLSEQIYTAAELGSEAKTIESIDFYKTTDGTYTRNLNIYMVLTTKNSFRNNSDWVSVTASDLVFSGNVTFGANAWATITLDTPFEYDGESNMLLVVDDNSGSAYSTNLFYTFTDNAYRTIYYRYDYNNPDPTTNISGIGGGITQTKNQIRLLFGEAPAVPKPAGFKTENASYHMARLSWAEKGTATHWQLCVNDDEENLLEVTENPYTIRGLSANTAYTVKVRAAGGEETSRWAGPITFTTRANPAPAFLQTNIVGPYTAEIEWSDWGDAEAWQLCVNGDEENLIDVTEEGYTLTGLTPETEYTVKVRGVIAGEECPWSDVLEFTTTEINPVPFNVAVTPKHTEATVGWTGFSDSYNVRYRTAAAIDPVYTEGFENGLNGWTLSNCEEGTGSHGNASGLAHSGSGLFVFYYTENPPQYLISPELTAVTDGMVLQFYYRNYNSDYPETFQIGFSSTTAETDAFTFGDVITATDEAWHRYRVVIPEGTKYICGKCTSDDQWMLYIDDIVIGTPTEAGQWQTIAVDQAMATLTGLTAGTDYELQVQGIVGEAISEWSGENAFTTLDADVKIFMADGNWNDDDNWEPAGAPTATDDVVIMAAAVIPAGVTAWARNITIEGMDNGGGEIMARAMTPQHTPVAASMPSITLKDGGQLRHATNSLHVIIEKNIGGYGDSSAGGYHLLAPPTHDYSTDVDGMTEGDYDLYEFTEAPTDGLEWRNFKAQSFWLFNNNESGYLYANSTDRVLAFNGESNMTASGATSYSIVSVINDVAPFTSGWRIFGNTSTANAYVDFGDIYNDDDGNFVPATSNFYKMNDAGDGFTLFKDYVEVAPGEAVFVQTYATGRLRWSYDPLYEEAPVAEEGTYGMPLLPQHALTTHQDANVLLADAGSYNSAVAEVLDGKITDITLQGRTLYKDGEWNTICLPFEVVLEGSPLEGAVAKTLTSATMTGTTVSLTFGEAVTTLQAGIPYIIKWAKAEGYDEADAATRDITAPVFTDVTVISGLPADRTITKADGHVKFIGYYDAFNINPTDNADIYYMTAGNTLKHTGKTRTLKACRAYFQFSENIVNSSRQFVLDFGDDSTTGVSEMRNEEGEMRGGNEEMRNGGEWYTIGGVKLDRQPTKKGVYIHHGRKEVVK